MERLTEWHDRFGWAMRIGSTMHGNGDTYAVGEPADRIAAYEDALTLPDGTVMGPEEVAALRARCAAAARFIANLVLLCEVPKELRDQTLRRIRIGAGDYMGSGYAFLDAFYKLLEGFMETADDELYRSVRRELDALSGPQEGVEHEKR